MLIIIWSDIAKAVKDILELLWPWNSNTLNNLKCPLLKWMVLWGTYLLWTLTSLLVRFVLCKDYLSLTTLYFRPPEARVFKIGKLCIYIFDMVTSQVKVNQIKIQVSKSQICIFFLLSVYCSLRNREKGLENENLKVKICNTCWFVGCFTSVGSLFTQSCLWTEESLHKWIDQCLVFNVI